jgi:hypothetical protein
MPQAIDINDWRAVPGRVAEPLPVAAKIRVAHEKAALAANILPIVGDVVSRGEHGHAVVSGRVARKTG